VIHEVEEGRPFYELKPLQLLVTLVCITLVAITALALVVWILASVAFAFYVANFGSYNETYGTLGGVVVVFLLWLWITNIAVLLGPRPYPGMSLFLVRLLIRWAG
jgi:uncharacterized BrkB/YihY/UPF0761 family membrane protein